MPSRPFDGKEWSLLACHSHHRARAVARRLVKRCHAATPMVAARRHRARHILCSINSPAERHLLRRDLPRFRGLPNITVLLFIFIRFLYLFTPYTRFCHFEDATIFH